MPFRARQEHFHDHPVPGTTEQNDKKEHSARTIVLSGCLERRWPRLDALPWLTHSTRKLSAATGPAQAQKFYEPQRWPPRKAPFRSTLSTQKDAASIIPDRD